MNLFSVGQRVRLLMPDGTRTDHEATIWHVGFERFGHWHHGTIRAGFVDPHEQPYLIDIDGLGRVDVDGVWYAAPARMLEPIVPPPALTTWDACPWMPREEVRT